MSVKQTDIFAWFEGLPTDHPVHAAISEAGGLASMAGYAALSGAYRKSIEKVSGPKATRAPRRYYVLALSESGAVQLYGPVLGSLGQSWGEVDEAEGAATVFLRSVGCEGRIVRIPEEEWVRHLVEPAAVSDSTPTPVPTGDTLARAEAEFTEAITRVAKKKR
jgi:hypothetical protein